jgi:Flp pilus assembly pilin Flp
MLSLIKRFHRQESGATATEYAMLIVFVALAIAVGAQTLGGGITNLLIRSATPCRASICPRSKDLIATMDCR